MQRTITMTERIHSSLAYLTPSEFEAVQVA